MTKKMRKLLGVLLALAMLTGISSVFSAIGFAAEYQAGDVIELGTYPQTLITDEALIAELNTVAEEAEWQWLAEIATSPSTRYAQYKDIIYQGTQYRKYYFTAYRNGAGGVADTIPNYMQLGNGYYKDTGYWFSFDPIRWTVVDSTSGLLIANTALDALPISVYAYRSGNDYYSDAAYRYFLNNYAHSTIRTWLNDHFKNTVFSDAEADVLLTAEIDNQTVPSNAAQYACENTTDTVFLPSLSEAQLLTGGRVRPGSDYALAQGVWNYGQGSGQFWFLRTPGSNSKTQRYVEPTGAISTGIETASRDVGIVPAIRISFSAYDDMLAAATETPDTPDDPQNPGDDTGYHAGDMIEFGSYPQTRVTDESLIAALEEAAAGLEWQSLGYAALDQAPFAFYKDVQLNGTRYRVQMYTEYRSNYSVGQGESTASCPLYLNGYRINTSYWFVFEPIRWRILDPANGLLFPEVILDAQAICKERYNESGAFITGKVAITTGYQYADDAHQYYLNNYTQSDVREWLINDFVATAFSMSEQSVLRPAEIDNSASDSGNESYMRFGSENTVDAVYLLSYGEVADTALFANNAARQRAGTDYARAQGLYRYNPSVNYDYWYLRTPGTGATSQGYVTDSGARSSGAESAGSDIGICPAVTISLAAYDALNNDSPDVPDEPDTPDQPDEPASSPYDDFTFSFANGILTVSGSGTLPTVDDLSQTPLAPYAQDCAVVILEGGDTTVSAGAFAGFDHLGILVANGPTVLENGAFAENENLQTVICSETVSLSGDPFAAGADIALYEAKNKPHTGDLPAGCQALPYSFSDGTLHVDGDAAMDTYGLLDFMAVMCGYYDEINYVKFRSYTSLDVPFYVFDATKQKYVELEDSTLKGVSFSVKIYGEEDWETVTFNYFCEHAQDEDLGSFHLVTKIETGEDVQENSFRIILDQIRSSIRHALKWIVSLLNFMFKILSSFRK